MADVRGKGAGVCSYASPRPELKGLGHHPLITQVSLENGVRTYSCKACGIEIVLPKDAKL